MSSGIKIVILDYFPFSYGGSGIMALKINPERLTTLACAIASVYSELGRDFGAWIEQVEVGVRSSNSGFNINILVKPTGRPKSSPPINCKARWGGYTWLWLDGDHEGDQKFGCITLDKDLDRSIQLSRALLVLIGKRLREAKPRDTREANEFRVLCSKIEGLPPLMVQRVSVEEVVIR